MLKYSIHITVLQISGVRNTAVHKTALEISDVKNMINICAKIQATIIFTGSLILNILQTI